MHHCHVLLHEDHGMMQTVKSIDRAEACNYNPRARVASHAMTGDEVSAIYPQPSLYQGTRIPASTCRCRR